MKRKLFVRIVAIGLAVLMALSVMLTIIASTASATASQSALDALEKQHEAIQQEMREIEAQINSLQYEEAAAQGKKQVLDQQIALTERGIDNLNDQITEYGNLIVEKQDEVEEYEREEAEQWDLFKVRIRAMEENGTISYYAILFEARDFSDMLSRMDVVESIMDYDKQLYNNLIDAREATSQAKQDLEDTVSAMEDTRAELEEQQALLETQVEEAVALISELNLTIDEQRELYNEKSEEEDKIKDEITAMEKALEEASRATTVGTGILGWPSDSYYTITSGFGPRNTGIAGASTNHKGIDIGAAYGSNVLACDSGTVLTAQYSSSYGNYITISHGNGITTLYAHMSKLLVSKGDTVSKGQVIGLVGATGIANGAHIHLEVWVNGTRVNPVNYVS